MTKIFYIPFIFQWLKSKFEKKSIIGNRQNKSNRIFPTKKISEIMKKLQYLYLILLLSTYCTIISNKPEAGEFLETETLKYSFLSGIGEYNVKGSIQIIHAMNSEERLIEFYKNFSISGDNIAKEDIKIILSKSPMPTSTDLHLQEEITTGISSLEGSQSYLVATTVDLSANTPYTYIVLWNSNSNKIIGNGELMSLPTTNKVILAGTFAGENGYNTEGCAQTVITPEGQYETHFSMNFKVNYTRNLYVYLLNSSEDTSYRDPAPLDLDIGKLEFSAGSQIYKWPKDLNPFRFDRVLIHCRAFDIPFGRAELILPNCPNP